MDAELAHARFRDEQSDFLSFLKLWDAYHEQAGTLGAGRLRAWCKANALSFIRLREWLDTHRQLSSMVRSLGWAQDEELLRTPPPKDVGPPIPGTQAHELRAGPIHRAILSGLLSNVGLLADRFEYTGRAGRFSIYPGSGLFRTTPKWIVAAELVRTTKLYARTVAAVQPSWIERAGAHVVKRAYAEPHWNERTAQVWAYERVTIWGLELIARRHVNYGPIDPGASRELFITQGLVEGRYQSAAPFAQHNQGLVREGEKLQAKLRRTDLVAGPDAQREFFEKRVPATVFSGREFEAWLRKEQRARPSVLHMAQRDLLAPGAVVMLGQEPDVATVDAGAAAALAPPAAGPVAQAFPDAIDIAGARLPLVYRYEPGHPEDGATLIVPVELLWRVPADRCEWLVPGVLKEKVIAMLRALPKDLRRAMVPVPEFAERVLRDMPFAQGSLRAALAERAGRLTAERISPSLWDGAALEPYLILNIRVVESLEVPADQWAAQTLAMGRDLAALRAQLKHRARSAAAAIVDSPWVRGGIRAWDFGHLPESVEFIDPASGTQRRAFPAIVDAGADASLRLLDTPDAARHASVRGMIRLAVLDTGEQIRFLVRDHAQGDACRLAYGLVGDGPTLERDLIDLIAGRAFFASESGHRVAAAPHAPVRDGAQFSARVDAGWHRLGEAADAEIALAARILTAHQRARVRLEEAQLALARPPWAASLAEVRAHLSHLVYNGFLARTPRAWLEHLPRFLRAIDTRLTKLTTGGAQSATRDQELAAQVRQWREGLASLRDRLEAASEPTAPVDEFAWLIEELCVSLFAQELGTSIPISAKRLERAWSRLPGV